MEVHDTHVIELFKKCYGLQRLQHESAKLDQYSNVRDGLLVFGTFTNWRVY